MIDQVLLNEAKIAKYLLINKMVFEFSGEISLKSFVNWMDMIYLKQKSGYQLNLFTRIGEIAINYKNRISISYWISKTPKTPEELITHNMLAADGYVNFELDSHEIIYSEYTQDIEYKTNFTIGGHSLYDELINHTGEYLYILIEVNDNNLLN